MYGKRRALLLIAPVVLAALGLTRAWPKHTPADNTASDKRAATPAEPMNSSADEKDAGPVVETAHGVATSPVTVPEGQGERFSQVQEGIRKGEYNITRQDKAVDGGPGGLHAANRANNLRAYFREDGVQIFERETSDPDWDVKWQFKAWGREGAMREVGRVEPKAEEHTNRLTYGHDGIEEWYVNDERGLEHGFTIAERPAGDGPLVIAGAFAGDAKATIGSAPNTITFKDANENDLLQYAKLEVIDAQGAEVLASMRQVAGETRLVVHDGDAICPIKVDPIYVPAPVGDWQNIGDQGFADFGLSVAGAGDINGDGYSDIVVGAPAYDDGQDGAGVAFVYYGSSSGLIGSDPSTAGRKLEGYAAMGHSVCGAGDVNGDGFADVAVGAPGAWPFGKSSIVITECGLSSPTSSKSKMSQGMLSILADGWLP